MATAFSMVKMTYTLTASVYYRQSINHGNHSTNLKKVQFVNQWLNFNKNLDFKVEENVK